MLWVNKEVKGEQIRIKCPDMTVAVVRFLDRLILVISVYVPREDSEALREIYDNLRKAVAGVRRDVGAVIKVVIAGDFNRYN